MKTNKTKKYILFSLNLLMLVFLTSCKEDGEYVAPRIAGYYQVETLEADAVVDLNNDGIASSNFKEEISHSDFLAPYHFDSPISYLEIWPTKYNDTHVQTIYIPFPHPHLTFEYTDSPNGAVTYLRNEINGIGYRYEYDSKHHSIQIDRTNVEDKNEELWGKLIDIQETDNNQLKVILSKNYYDFKTESWVKLTVTGINVKVQL